MCDANDKAELRGIAEALIAGTLADLQYLNLAGLDQLEEPEDVAHLLSGLVQEVSKQQEACVEVFPKRQLMLAEVSKTELGRNTYHMDTFVFKPAGGNPPTYFGLGSHNEGIALFDIATDEMQADRKTKAELRAVLKECLNSGILQKFKLDDTLQGLLIKRLAEVLAEAEPTDHQRALLELRIGKNWRDPDSLSVDRLGTAAMFGLLELMGHPMRLTIVEVAE